MDFKSLFTEKERKTLINKNYKKTLFLNLFSDWILEAKKNISVDEEFFSSNAASVSLNSLYDVIIEISERALYVEYEVILEKVKKNKSNEETLNLFEKKLLEYDYRKYLLREYPVLFRLIYNSIQNFINNLNDVISNYIKDIKVIKKDFNIVNSEIEYIRIGLGDRHNKSKCTSLIKIKNEAPIIYKPRDLAIEICLFNFLNYYNDSQNTCIYLPKIIYRKNYSWTEYIEGSNQKINKKKLYGEIGHIISILYFLNGVDFHYENLIINNTKGMVLIDCESLLYPIKNIKDNQHNVLSIGILSQKIKIGDHHIDLGGLNIEIKNKEIQEFPFFNNFINIENGTMKLSEVKNKFIKPNNLQINPGENIEDFKEEILDGFKKSYLFLMKNKNKIISFFTKNFPDLPIRFLIRDTYVYSHILYESLSPILLTNKKNRINFLNQLNGSYNGISDIIESEILDIYNNDIPYYFCSLNSKNLNNHNGLNETLFFDKSPLESLIYKLNNIVCKKDLDHQLQLIKYSFAQNTSRNQNHIFQNKYVFENINLSFNFFKSIIEKNNTYYTLQESYTEANQYNIEYSNNDIIKGKLGDILYLAEANKIIEDKSISILISRLYQDHIANIDSINHIGMAGIAGGIYFHTRMYKVYHEKKYIDDILKYIEMINLFDLIDSCKNNGVIYGKSGLLIALVELNKIHHTPEIENLVHYTYKKLISAAENDKNGIYWFSEFHQSPLCGMAHGSSGIVLSLVRYYNLFKKADTKDFIKKAISFENTFYCDNNKNWRDNRDFVDKKLEYSSYGWAHGSPGIGLVRLEILKSNIFATDTLFVKILNKDLKNCVDSTYNNGLNGNDSLIFGKYGNVELLVRFSQYINNPKFIINMQGFLNSFTNLYLIKNNKSLIIPGLFNGISGCGYQLLLFSNHIKNSILTFECN